MPTSENFASAIDARETDNVSFSYMAVSATVESGGDSSLRSLRRILRDRNIADRGDDLGNYFTEVRVRGEPDVTVTRH